MTFTLKLGDIIDFTPFLSEVYVANPSDDGFIQKIAHPGGVYQPSVSPSGNSLPQLSLCPDFARKSLSLLRVLNDSFSISQLNSNLKIYREVDCASSRSLRYSVFILTDINFVVLVCDQYGEAIRFKKYDEDFPVANIIHEITANPKKGQLDRVGFSRASMNEEAYNNDSSRESFFQELIQSNAFVDNSVAQTLLLSHSLQCLHSIYAPLVAQVKEFFKGDNNYLDISKVTGKNKKAFQSTIIRFSELAGLFNVDRVPGHVRWDMNCSVFQILRAIYYNCPESLKRINQKDKPRIELPPLEELKLTIFNKFSDEHGSVDISFVSTKNIVRFSEYFGMSFVRIAPPFNIKGKNITSFIEILKQVFTDEVSRQRLDDKLSEITVVKFSDDEILSTYRDYFSDESHLVDFSKVNIDEIHALNSNIGISLYVALKQIMPDDQVFSVNVYNLLQLLIVVYKDSPHNLKLITDYRDRMYPDCDIEECVYKLKKELSDENGVFDLSISLTPIIQNFHSLVGVTAGTFISLLNFELPISRFDTPSSFLPVLKYLYSDCTKSLDRIDTLESRLSKEFISDKDLIDRIKNHFSEGDLVSGKKLSHDSVRSLRQEIGIGAQAIFTRFNRQSDNANSITEFLPFLLDLFADCAQSVNIIQAKIIKFNSRT